MFLCVAMNARVIQHLEDSIMLRFSHDIYPLVFAHVPCLHVIPKQLEATV